MHSLIAIIVVGSFAFIGTMFDNFFAFAAQLSLTPRERFARVSYAHALAVLTLIGLAAGVGTLLVIIPTRWIGILCVAPWALAAHAWRHRSDPGREQYRRGAITTFTICIALGGDNLAGEWFGARNCHRRRICWLGNAVPGQRSSSGEPSEDRRLGNSVRAHIHTLDLSRAWSAASGRMRHVHLKV